MKSGYHIENITIDTSFIERQNFLVGSKINDLTKLVRDGNVRLYITDITYREIYARFHKKCDSNN